MSSTPAITNVYPAPGAMGIAIGDQVQVTFNQEMDETSINTGTFVVVGPDTGVQFQDEINPWDEPGFDDEDILSSPYFKGYVKGTIVFSRVDAYGAEVDDSMVDYTGVGNLWNTVATFVPDKPFAVNKQYTVFILGDENASNDFDSGVRTRTVFDTQETKTGTGILVFGGGYTGDNIRNYTLKITTGGAAGTAEYEWWDNSSPLVVYSGRTSTGRREFEDGIWVECDPDGTFALDDTFQVKVVPFVAMPQNYKWSFTTGSGSIAVPPSEYSASGIQELTSGGLQVVSVTPALYSTNLDPETIEAIVITFNKALDETTITDDTVLVWSESVNGDTAFVASGDIVKILNVSGNTLTIQIN